MKPSYMSDRPSPLATPRDVSHVGAFACCVARRVVMCLRLAVLNEPTISIVRDGEAGIGIEQSRDGRRRLRSTDDEEVTTRKLGVVWAYLGRARDEVERLEELFRCLACRHVLSGKEGTLTVSHLVAIGSHDGDRPDAEQGACRSRRGRPDLCDTPLRDPE